MIAYALQANRRQDLDDYRRYAAPGLRRVMRPGDRLQLFHGSSIHQGYNQAIHWARLFPRLEALVLLHADAEILDEHFGRRLTNLLRKDHLIGLVGVAGASRCRNLSWWDERGTAGGGWEDKGLLGGCWHREGEPFTFHTRGDHRAAVVDGVVLALNTWAVYDLYFDEYTYAMAPWYAYDCDFSEQVAARGGKVFAMDTRVRHHTAGGISDWPAFFAAEDAFVRKWGLHG